MEMELIQILIQGGSGAFVGFLMYKLAREELRDVKKSVNGLENKVVEVLTHVKKKK